jgi:hypothetical protein
MTTLFQPKKTPSHKAATLSEIKAEEETSATTSLENAKTNVNRQRAEKRTVNRTQCRKTPHSL